MTSTSTEERYVSRMAARLEDIDRVCGEIRGFLANAQYDAQFFEISLVAREALLNAVAHGCGGDASLWIDVQLTLEAERMVLEVRDPGPGFDWQAQKKAATGCSDIHGRGLAIFEHYCDRYEYNVEGNHVRLCKSITHLETTMSEVIREDGKATIRPPSDIVASMAGPLKRELKALVDEGVQDLTIDLKNVEMVDSVGLGTFIATCNSLKQVGGHLTVSHVSPDVETLLRTMRLDQHFTVVSAVPQT